MPTASNVVITPSPRNASSESYPPPVTASGLADARSTYQTETRLTSTSKRVARLATEVLAPPPVAGVLLVAVSWSSAESPLKALRWACLALTRAALVPALYIALGVRLQRLTDRHVLCREQRPRPLLVGLTSVLVGYLLLAASGAPRDVLTLLVAMAVGLAVSLLMTLAWKVSMHTSLLAGVVVVTAFVFGRVFLVLVPLLVLLGWARVELGHHTPAAVLGGAVVGANVAVIVSSLLR